MEQETRALTTADRIREKCDDLRGLLLSKNERYNDSALNPVRIFSQADTAEQLRVRIDDKLSRLLHGADEWDDEDTLMDLAGYLILLMIAEEPGPESDQPRWPE